MKLPISNRLRCCAEMVSPGCRVADIGCDHGYLGIYLVSQGVAEYVIASDLRPMPLESARSNAIRFGMLEKMDFRLGSGLQTIAPSEVDTIICAGMGGELIAQLLDAVPWLCDSSYTLILQPQASGNDLRRWLGEHGFVIEMERLVEDGRFLYSALRAKYGEGRPLTPGEQYVSAAVLREPPQLRSRYLRRVYKGLVKAVRGLEQSRDIQRLAYYRQALAETEEVMRRYGECFTDSELFEDTCTGAV